MSERTSIWTTSLRLKADGWTAGTNEVVAGGRRVEQQTLATVRAQHSLKELMKSIIKQALAMTAAFLSFYAAVDAGRVSIEFDDSIEQIVNLVGVGREQVQAWRGDLLKLGPELGRGPNELAGALFQVTSAGERGAGAIDVLAASGKAAAVGLGSTADVASTVVSALEAYGRENLTAARSTEILFNAVRLGKMEASQLAPTLGKVTPIASILGVTFDQVNAYVARNTKLNGSAAQSVTGLTAVFNAFLKPTDSTREVLDDLHTSVEGVIRSFKERGLAETLVDLITRLDGDTEAVGRLIPSVEGLSSVLGVVGQDGSDYLAIAREMAKETNGLETAFGNVSDSPGHKFRQIAAAIETFKVALGDQLARALADVLTRLRELAGDSDKMERIARELAEVIRAAGDVFFWLAGHIKLVTTVLGVLLALKVAWWFTSVTSSVAYLLVKWALLTTANSALAGTLANLVGFDVVGAFTAWGASAVQTAKRVALITAAAGAVLIAVLALNEGIKAFTANAQAEIDRMVAAGEKVRVTWDKTNAALESRNAGQIQARIKEVTAELLAANERQEELNAKIANLRKDGTTPTEILKIKELSSQLQDAAIAASRAEVDLARLDAGLKTASEAAEGHAKATGKQIEQVKDLGKAHEQLLAGIKDSRDTLRLMEQYGIDLETAREALAALNTEGDNTPEGVIVKLLGERSEIDARLQQLEDVRAKYEEAKKKLTELGLERVRIVVETDFSVQYALDYAVDSGATEKVISQVERDVAAITGALPSTDIAFAIDIDQEAINTFALESLGIIEQTKNGWQDVLSPIDDALQHQTKLNDLMRTYGVTAQEAALILQAMSEYSGPIDDEVVAGMAARIVQLRTLAAQNDALAEANQRRINGEISGWERMLDRLDISTDAAMATGEAFMTVADILWETNEGLSTFIGRLGSLISVMSNPDATKEQRSQAAAGLTASAAGALLGGGERRSQFGGMDGNFAAEGAEIGSYFGFWGAIVGGVIGSMIDNVETAVIALVDDATGRSAAVIKKADAGLKEFAQSFAGAVQNFIDGFGATVGIELAHVDTQIKVRGDRIEVTVGDVTAGFDSMAGALGWLQERLIIANRDMGTFTEGVGENVGRLIENLSKRVGRGSAADLQDALTLAASLDKFKKTGVAPGQTGAAAQIYDQASALMKQFHRDLELATQYGLKHSDVIALNTAAVEQLKAGTEAAIASFMGATDTAGRLSDIIGQMNAVNDVAGQADADRLRLASQTAEEIAATEAELAKVRAEMGTRTIVSANGTAQEMQRFSEGLATVRGDLRRDGEALGHMTTGMTEAIDRGSNAADAFGAAFTDAADQAFEGGRSIQDLEFKLKALQDKAEGLADSMGDLPAKFSLEEFQRVWEAGAAQAGIALGEIIAKIGGDQLSMAEMEELRNMQNMFALIHQIKATKELLAATDMLSAKTRGILEGLVEKGEKLLEGLADGSIKAAAQRAGSGNRKQDRENLLEWLEGLERVAAGIEGPMAGILSAFEHGLEQISEMRRLGLADAAARAGELNLGQAEDSLRDLIDGAGADPEKLAEIVGQMQALLGGDVPEALRSLVEGILAELPALEELEAQARQAAREAFLAPYQEILAARGETDLETSLRELTEGYAEALAEAAEQFSGADLANINRTMSRAFGVELRDSISEELERLAGDVDGLEALRESLAAQLENLPEELRENADRLGARLDEMIAAAIDAAVEARRIAADVSLVDFEAQSGIAPRGAANDALDDLSARADEVGAQLREAFTGDDLLARLARLGDATRAAVQGIGNDFLSELQGVGILTAEQSGAFEKSQLLMQKMMFLSQLAALSASDGFAELLESLGMTEEELRAQILAWNGTGDTVGGNLDASASALTTATDQYVAQIDRIRDAVGRLIDSWTKDSAVGQLERAAIEFRQSFENALGEISAALQTAGNEVGLNEATLRERFKQYIGDPDDYTADQLQEMLSNISASLNPAILDAFQVLIEEDRLSEAFELARQNRIDDILAQGASESLSGVNGQFKALLDHLYDARAALKELGASADEMAQQQANAAEAVRVFWDETVLAPIRAERDAIRGDDPRNSISDGILDLTSSLAAAAADATSGDLEGFGQAAQISSQLRALINKPGIDPATRIGILTMLDSTMARLQNIAPPEVDFSDPPIPLIEQDKLAQLQEIAERGTEQLAVLSRIEWALTRPFRAELPREIPQGRPMSPVYAALEPRPAEIRFSPDMRRAHDEEMVERRRDRDRMKDLERQLHHLTGALGKHTDTAQETNRQLKKVLEGRS